VSYVRNVGVEHNVVNANDFEIVFVEAENAVNAVKTASIVQGKMLPSIAACAIWP
jgi:hypothetical protein